MNTFSITNDDPRIIESEKMTKLSNLDSNSKSAKEAELKKILNQIQSGKNKGNFVRKTIPLNNK